MNAESRWMKVALVFAIATSIACSDDEIDHKTAQQSISANTAEVSKRVASSIAFLDESLLMQDAFQFGASECLSSSSGADFDTGECSVEPFELDDAEMQRAIDEATGVLETRIFASGNVEAENGSTVTYLLRGNVVCNEGGSVDADCANAVDDAEIRLVVSAPATDDIKIEFQIGPTRARPLDLELGTTELAANLYLGGVKGAVEHLALLDGEVPDLPAQMSGTLRLALKAESDTRASLTFSVIDAINVQSDEWRLAVGKSSPTFQLTADAALETLESRADLAAIDARFPSIETSYDAVSGETIEVTRRIDLALGGASSATVLSVGDDTLTVTDIGLGDTTTRLSIDGNDVLAVDLNPTDGRRFNATISALEGDAVEVALSPVFDLMVDMNFINAPEVFDVDDWMLDETLSIVADGANGSRLLFADDQVEVLEGNLSITLGNAAISHQAGEGQCLLTDDQPPVAMSGDSTCSESECTVELEDSSNPFDEILVGNCQ